MLVEIGPLSFSGETAVPAVIAKFERLVSAEKLKRLLVHRHKVPPASEPQSMADSQTPHTCSSAYLGSSTRRRGSVTQRTQYVAARRGLTTRASFAR